MKPAKSSRPRTTLCASPSSICKSPRHIWRAWTAALIHALGSFHASQIAAQAEAGRNYDIGDTTLTPNILAHWVNYNPGSYTETRAGGANLHVDGNTMNQVELGVGLKAGWMFRNEDGSFIKPQLRAGYRYRVPQWHA